MTIARMKVMPDLTRVSVRVSSWVRRHPVRATAVIAAVAAAAQMWWIAAHCRQGAFDGDQAGYLSTALRFEGRFRADGLGGLLDDVLHNYRIGPLVPLLSVPFLVVGGRSVVWAMAIIPIFYFALAVLTSAIVVRCSSAAASFAAGIVALGLPVTIISARSYHLALPAAAFLLTAVWALLVSDRGRSWKAMVLFGAAVGAMMITRTASATFLPGLALATVLHVRWSAAAVARLAGAAAACAAVAAPWWVTSWQSVWDYMVKFGYGTGADDLGPSSPLERAAVRIGVMSIEVRPLLYLPALVVLVTAGVRWWRGHGKRRPSRAAWSSPLAVVWSVLVLGGLGLTTSSNIGTYLQTPLVMLAVAGVAMVGAATGGRVVRGATKVAVIGAVANLLLVSNWAIGSGIPITQTSYSIVLFGGIETTYAIDFADGDPRFLPTASDSDRAEATEDWADAANRLAAALHRVEPPSKDMMYTFFGDIRLLEAGTLALATQLTGNGIHQWESPTARSTVGDGIVPLDPFRAGVPRVLVAVVAARRTTQEGYPPGPVIDQAEAAGWKVSERVRLPDGGVALVFTHPDSLP